MLLLLFSAALGSVCSDIASEAEKWTVVEYSPDLGVCSLEPKDWYVNYSKRAEAYATTAKCYTTTEYDKERESYWYGRAALMYSRSAETLCASGDASKKIRILISAGESFDLSGDKESAMESYQAAQRVYDDYKSSASLEGERALLQQKILMSQYSDLPSQVTENPADAPGFDVVAASLIGVLLVFSGFFIAYVLRSRK